jgi:hypothetical protein
MSQICAITSTYCGNLLCTSTVRRATPPRVPTEKGSARHACLPADPTQPHWRSRPPARRSSRRTDGTTFTDLLPSKEYEFNPPEPGQGRAAGAVTIDRIRFGGNSQDIGNTTAFTITIN